MAKTQAVIATKCERNSKIHVGVFAPRISGTMEATIGIIRTEDSVTARKQAARLAPPTMEPIRIILAGKAQMTSVMNTASPRATPDSSAKALKPTKDVMRMSEGSENMPRIPRKNQPRNGMVSLSAVCIADPLEHVARKCRGLGVTSCMKQK
ncbi:hypothetical protein D3C78_1366220 [compost metagenome]